MTTDTAEAAPVAPAAEQLHPTHETAYYLELGAIRPSPFNPRKRFDQAKIDDLADKIAKQGVLQAIVVREVPAAKAGGATYEIVAGERRWRACKALVERGHAAPHVISAFIRKLDDLEAAEVALTENAGRQDLHPLEEAQAYENLLLKPVGGGEFKPARLKGYTVEQLAERIGHKPNFVFGRLKLLQLIPAAREAFLADKLQLKIAEALARLPTAEQERALEDITRGWAGEPFTHRQAMAHLRQHFMLKLSKAVFPIADAGLVAKAGACTACPKRSSASPDLFGEAVAGDDMCLDSACFDAKGKAHAERQVDKAREQGKTVLVGKAAEKVVGKHGSATSDYQLKAHGHVNLDRAAPELTGSKKTLRTLLGEGFDKAIVVKGEHDEQPANVAKVADVKAALKEKGLLAATKDGKKITAEDIEKQREDRVDKMLGERLPAALMKHFDGDKAYGFPGESAAWLRWIAVTLWQSTDADVDALQAAMTGSQGSGGFDWLHKLNAEKLARVVMAMVLGDELKREVYPHHNIEQTGDGKTANALAKEIGFDLVALRKDVADEVDGALRDEIQQLADVVAPAAKKTTGAKKVAKGAPTPRSDAAAPGDQSPATEGKKDQLTPEKALATAVAKERKAKAKSTTPKTEQKDDTAKPPASTDQTPKIGERWKVRVDVKGRSKTAGREGAVDAINEGMVTLRWGPRAHEVGVYMLSEIEPATSVAQASAKPVLSAAAAWPFPMRPAARL